MSPLPVSVTDVSVGEGCPKCWTRVASPVNEKSPLQINPGTTANLPVDLFPNSIHALLQGALVVKAREKRRPDGTARAWEAKLGP
jgi:hypothetical protein